MNKRLIIIEGSRDGGDRQNLHGKGLVVNLPGNIFTLKKEVEIEEQALSSSTDHTRE